MIYPQTFPATTNDISSEHHFYRRFQREMEDTSNVYYSLTLITPDVPMREIDFVIVNRYGNGAFKRKGNARFPIEQLWGPAVPVEMLRDEAHAAWTDQHPRVLRESERLIVLMLAGAQIGASPRKRKAS
jgi:hypothetical protein